VVEGQTTAHVRIDVGGVIVTASITNEAVDGLGLRQGIRGLRRHQGLDVTAATGC
jgi:molybdopterin-binding protein